MPPKRNNADRRRKRRLFDATYIPPEGRDAVASITQGAPRHNGRHTRSRWASPIVDGLPSARVPDIVARGFVPATNFSAVDLPPPPPLGTRRRPARRKFPGVFNTPPPQIQSAMLTVFGTNEIRQNILSHLNRAEQDNVRLMSRHIAAFTPPFNSLTGALRQSQSTSIACQNRRWPGRTTAAPAPGTPGPPNRVWPLRTTPRVHCMNTAATRPDLRFRPCDGPRLLWPNVVPTPSYHDEAFTICEHCSLRANLDFEIDDFYGERSLPLCYQCSADKISSKWWARCRCYEETSPDRYFLLNPKKTYFFCSDCRELFTNEVIIKKMLEKVEDTYKLRLRPNAGNVDPASSWERLRARVFDTDPVHRNFCICGLSYTDIPKTYPRRAPPNNNLPDFRWLFRECLVCGYHVTRHRPRTRPSTCY